MVKKISPIAFASDHAGYNLKNHLYAMLKKDGYNVIDLGSDNAETSVDYPDFGFAMGKAISDGTAKYGILVCGSGIGISIAANRYPLVRAVLCHDTTVARLSREHNNANVIAFGERLIGNITAEDCVRVFLDTSFAGGRHQKRIDKLAQTIT